MRFEPIVHLATGDLWGLEAVADQPGELLDLRRVLDASADAAHTATSQPVTVSIDVPPARFESPYFAREVENALRRAGRVPGSVVFDICSSPAFEQPDRAVATMEQLHEIGIRLAIDDFGEGSASFAAMRRLPHDICKIGASLVAEIAENDEAASLVATILSLSENLGVEVVALGVEGKAQADELRRLGCAYAQGGFFARPPRRRPQQVADPGPPLSIDPAVGWRVWRLGHDDGEFRLESVNLAGTWIGGEPFRARCKSGGHVTVPDASCLCGIYAASTPEYLARAGVFGTTSVVGAIAMWGTVVEHVHGLRAELAYPARLRLVCARCLREGFGGVAPKIVATPPGDDCVALCGLHAIFEPGPRWRASDVEAQLLSTYAVDLMPIERVSSALELEQARRELPISVKRLRASTVRAMASISDAIVLVLKVAFWIWFLSGFLVLGLIVVAAVVGLFIPDK